MYDRKALARRIKRAKIEVLQKDVGDNVSLDSIGQRVGQALRSGPMSKGQVSAYLHARVTDPPITVVAAFAEACHVDAAWLGFGDEHIKDIPRASAAKVATHGTPAQPTARPDAKRKKAGD